MPDILKELTPIARKEHICMYCGCKIAVGEKYQRDTLIYDGTIYDWVAHTDCHSIASELDMYDWVDDGLSGEDFREYVDQYLYDNYYDEETEDVREDILSMSFIEKVRFILSERAKKKE